MAADRPSMEIDRRESVRSQPRVSMQHDGGDDLYSMEAMDIPDGFEPIGTLHFEEPYDTPPTQDPFSDRHSMPPPRPSSISKPRYGDSLTLRHDGDRTSTMSRGLGSGPVTAIGGTTSNSTMIEGSLATSQGEHDAASGPSHPYHLYSQETRLERTASTATTSTYRPNAGSQYTGPGGPTHPYGLYPQTIVPESEAGEDEPLNQNIPIGFPGHQIEYQRRIGPDGEEIEIINEDGSSESLPPYSQYPEVNLATKLTVPPRSLAASGSGGIGLATRNPEFTSTDDLRSSLSPTRSQDRESDRLIDTGLPELSEKRVEPKWKVIARRRACGIVPVWFVVIISSVTLLFMIIVATAVSVVKVRQNEHYTPPPPPEHSSAATSAYPDGPNAYATITTTVDATPLASVPTGLPSLPVGTYGLSLATVGTQTQTCLDNASQYAVWSCSLPFSELYMTLSSVAGFKGANEYQATISQPMNSDNTTAWFYGAQPPIVAPNQTMDLVRDTDAGLYGPAWFFQLPYDKLVILPETALSATTSKRDANHNIPGFFRRGTINAGEKPWFCHWNGTFLEMFVYANSTSASGTTTTTTMTSTTTGPWSMPSDYRAPYPKVVRVEERRVSSYPDIVPPYCEQMLVLDDGGVNPVADPQTGVPIKVDLNETESPTSAFSRRALALTPRDPDRVCNCVWLIS